MQSQLPKVLHLLAGKPILAHVMGRLRGLGLSALGLVLGADTAPFSTFLEENKDIRVCIQSVPNGTGGAVAAAAGLFGCPSPSYASAEILRGGPFKHSFVLICAGDVPGLDHATLQTFLAVCEQEKAPLAVLGMNVPDPRGYGRLILDQAGRLDRIVEEKDATDAEKKITSCNSGVFFASVPFLFDALQGLTNSNQQGEYYLTDVVAIARQKGIKPAVMITSKWQQFSGINTAAQLSAVEAFMQDQG